MDQPTSSNPGKGLGITGFVLSLVALVGYFIVGGIATMQALTTGGGGTTMIIWIVLCLAAVVLSILGFQKSAKVGAKKGLAIAGLVIGGVALILSLLAYSGLSKVASDPTLQQVRDEAKQMLEEGLNDLEQDIERHSGEADTTATQ